MSEGADPVSDIKTVSAGGRPVGTEELGERHLSVVDAIAQSIGPMGPVFSAALVLPLIVGAGVSGKGAGIATPFAIILAMVGIGGLGWIIATYSRRVHAAGALYDYVTDGFGQRVGFLAGWLYFGCALVLGAGIVEFVGGFTSSFLSSSYHVNISYWVLDLVYAVLLFCLLYFGVRISTRAQLLMAGVSFFIVLGFFLYIIAKGGHGGNTGAPFDPSKSVDGWSGIFFGVIYGILIFVGFEQAANLGEETANPKRSVPIAILGSIFIGGLFFVIAGYAQDIGFGLHTSAWISSPAPLLTLGAANEFGNSPFVDLLNIVVIIDMMAVGLGTSLTATRGVFALARDRRIPGVFARVSRRWGTPVNAILLQVAIGVGFVLLARIGDGVFALNGSPQYYPLFAWMIGLGGLGLVVVYATISLGAVPGLWHHTNKVGLIVAAILGFVVSAGAVWGAIYKVPAPDNTWIWYIVAWVVVGGGLTAFNLRYRANSQVRRETPAPALEAAD